MTRTRISRWTGPTAVEPEAPLSARRLIDLANLVPAGRWVSPADLAFAYAVRYGKPITVREIAEDLVPDAPVGVGGWTLPWHRVRLDDGRSIARKYGSIGLSHDLDRMFEAEGGEIHDGVAGAGPRFELIGPSSGPTGRHDRTAPQSAEMP